MAGAAAGALSRLTLLTNARCAAAIHLYDEAGFVHDASVVADGARHAGATCDVAAAIRNSRPCDQVRVMLAHPSIHGDASGDRQCLARPWMLACASMTARR